MKNSKATTGLIFNESMIYNKSSPGRIGISIPKPEVDHIKMADHLIGDEPDLPELSEFEIVRHYTRLSQWNFCIDSGMYPLGSCTMKYNPKLNDIQANRSGFTNSHPLLEENLSQGCLELMYELENDLLQITGFKVATLQPCAGAQGEFTGILMIHKYHEMKGKQRTKILIPESAHGTNPATAALCKYKVVEVPAGDNGILDPQKITELMDEDTAGIMITNPNTVGLFENNIKKITKIVHEKGGLVYGDGANMNAIMGIVKPAELGIDVMHLNLHKTFSTPHGGGGPGSGPVLVNEKLEPFLPVPRVIKDGTNFKLKYNNPNSIGKLHGFYGQFGVLVRAYSYIKSLGGEGLKKVSENAVLNANYIKEKLKDVYHLTYDMDCMHECVLNDEKQKPYNITTMDIAKRLLDFGFHAPTIYFPLVIPGALMIEPTETEPKTEIDGFIDAMRTIAKEAETNPEILKSAPHKAKLKRLDEVGAARKPCLKG